MILGMVGLGLALTSAIPIAASSSARVGDSYEVISDRESSTDGPTVFKGSTSDRDAIVERVLAVRPDGVELEYDLPKDASADERRSQWQLPARIFQPLAGPPQLLNRAELEQRVDPWLKSGGMTRAACGHLIFTWNAFPIDCDPESAVKIAETFDLQPPELREGALFHDPQSAASARLVRKAINVNGSVYAASMTIDPDAIRLERAKTDVAIGEITRKPVLLSAALRSHASDSVTGTITITFEADASGQVQRRTKLTRYTITSAKGTETDVITETLDRKCLA